MSLSQRDLFAPRRCWVIGVLNVTPDSFSDGGLYLSPTAARLQGQRLAKAGADIVDVGGESTRPGAVRVSLDEELSRVIPVVSALSEEGISVSIDTMRAEVAKEAVAAGAIIVNDVSGGLADPAMYATVAKLRTPYIAMHWRGHSDRMADLAHYDDVVVDVRAELADRLRDAIAGGIREDRIVLDPGIGFAKRPEHNWELLANLDELASLGRPLMVGVSRKKFLGFAIGVGHEELRPPEERDVATSVLSGMCAQVGVWAVRAHDARGARDAVLVGRAMRRAAR